MFPDWTEEKVKEVAGQNKSIRETAWRGYFSRGEQNVLNADFAPQPTSEEKILN